ncbi:MAG: class III extradiol dioxygenase subunit B-like domain-containing protein [Micromonosporaceae bacterium]
MSETGPVAVAFCPQPPLLVPEIAGGAAAELDGLRAACDEAIRRMYAAGAAYVVVLAGDSEARRYPASSFGDFGRYGAPGVRVGFGRFNCAGASQLPLGLLVGSWLLRRAGQPAGVAGKPLRIGQTITTAAPPQECADLGALLADTESPLGLLVMGDGSARRTEKAPGYLDPRAAAYDAAVAGALGKGDRDALAELDSALAAELMVAGRAPWQVLAGAAAGRNWQGELLYHDAPYGVGYLVASWMLVP